MLTIFVDYRELVKPSASEDVTQLYRMAGRTTLNGARQPKAPARKDPADYPNFASTAKITVLNSTMKTGRTFFSPQRALNQTVLFKDYAPRRLGLLRERYASESIRYVDHLEKIMASVKFKGGKPAITRFLGEPISNRESTMTPQLHNRTLSTISQQKAMSTIAVGSPVKREDLQGTINQMRKYSSVLQSPAKGPRDLRPIIKPGKIVGVNTITDMVSSVLSWG